MVLAVPPVETISTPSGRKFYFLLLDPAHSTDEISDGDPHPNILPSINLSPNPASGDVSIRFSRAISEGDRLAIFDMQGRCVATEKLHGIRGAGGKGSENCVIWDGRDWSGHPVRSGFYLIRLESADPTIGPAERESSGRVLIIR